MLTDAEIRREKPGARVRELVDGGGLSLAVQPTGAKIWRLRYRVAGQRKRVVLGKYPDVKLSKARTMAAKLRGEIAAGGDPAAQRAADRAATRMVDLLGAMGSEGWYLKTYCRTARKSESTIASDRYRIGKHLRKRSAFLQKRVVDVTPVELDRIKRSVSAGTWRKLRDILRVCFRHAEQVGTIPAGSNPAAATKAKADRKLERFLTPAERKRLERALDSAVRLGPRQEGGLAPAYVRLFRLLALTGCRLGEILDLRWEHVGWRHKILRLPTSKTGKRDVPLTDQAVAYLKNEMGAVGRVGRVCAGEEGARLSNAQRAWRSVRKAAKLEDLRLHDLRHSWASDAASAGVPLAVIGAVLGHRSTQTTARYAHLHDKAIREGLKVTGDAIEAATGGKKGRGRKG